MNCRSVVAIVLLVAIFAIDWTILRYAAEYFGYVGMLVQMVASAAIGLLVIGYALRKHGSAALQAVRMCRSYGYIFSPDHSLEYASLDMVGLLVAGLLLLLPGIVTDLVGLCLLLVRPFCSLAADTVVWIAAPRIFGEMDDIW